MHQKTHQEKMKSSIRRISVEGFEAVIDPKSMKTYYQNRSTGEVTWDRPKKTTTTTPDKDKDKDDAAAVAAEEEKKVEKKGEEKEEEKKTRRRKQRRGSVPFDVIKQAAEKAGSFDIFLSQRTESQQDY